MKTGEDIRNHREHRGKLCVLKKNFLSKIKLSRCLQCSIGLKFRGKEKVNSN